MLKKKIIWFIIGVLVILVVLLGYVGSLVEYAETEVRLINNVSASLEAMSGIDSVESIHRFNGLESYIVARVLYDQQEVYFFVRDGTIQHYIGSAEMLAESDAQNIAVNFISGGDIHHTQLGIIGETPIFEVQIALGDARHYVVINAKSGNVIMNFDL